MIANIFSAREKKSSKKEQVHNSASEDLAGLDTVDRVDGSPNKFVVTTTV